MTSLICSPEFLYSSNMSKEDLNPEWVRTGSTVRELRELRGVKIDELATGILISRAYLANIEAGRKRLSAIHAALIAEFLVVRQISILRPDEFPADAA